ncbi:dihydroxyacetone kinase subunit DhaK [Staphylococcus gallinarum]|jgi:dihydroxyacetone kinase-like protein|uniref:Dihydroxyacetone kinase subunit DhaK n=1 Tax=Staphylococcus gallinarum TaxID=1293 RepID=A0ABQ0Y331_STAGA|nr:dihydroxyacetone kinase subunit DhaK [Staphylococcus gallinarum]KIR11244.1 dihydroxyacetone kinase [Staphylococcus gallinarum]MCD8821437.1 dihydroxyacetone kinase subunit DhaK [Staphylococcus gallinarum]MCD8900087.1 dihydroxyacetone kinase subunit DhaK [Staphylococcus gallinarum]MCD8903341.1 dihydroxyacetone kinase subunit DhaK [Staphylococcus gallinarum]MCD8910440.1 dihydroxyacetone kinase subunit DhaK [Staphylococcus gallinarum]
MKKMINNPDDVIDELVDGYVIAYPDYIRRTELHQRALIGKKRNPDRQVSILIGGGSGHEPGFLGYVGAGMADGVAVGNIFASPSPIPIQAVTKEIDDGHGVLYIYGNYAGDLMNFEMASEMTEIEDDIETAVVIGNDDVASSKDIDDRRGIAGELLVYKAAGAAADFGYDLDEVKRIAQLANDNTRSMGIGLSPCYLPQTGKPSFDLEENEMEIGLGHHGEPGIEKTTIRTAQETVQVIMQNILKEGLYQQNDEVVVLVNGLGATSQMELYIINKEVAAILNERNIKTYKTYIGNFITSMEMGGFSVTLMKVDETLKRCISHPVDCPNFKEV